MEDTTMKQSFIYILIVVVLCACDFTRIKSIKHTDCYYLATSTQGNINIYYTNNKCTDGLYGVTSIGAGWTIKTVFSDRQYMIAFVTDYDGNIVEYILIEMFPNDNVVQQPWATETFTNKKQFENRLQQKHISMKNMAKTQWYF